MSVSRMQIKEKFELANGTTVLACSGCDPQFNATGKQVSIVFGSEVKQIITLSGERKMLNQTTNLNQRAFETRDIIELSAEEARSSEWSVVYE